MVTLNLNKLPGDRSHYWLAQTTHIALPTIQRMAKSKTQRIEFARLDKLCDALNCEPGDLLTKEPETRRS